MNSAAASSKADSDDHGDAGNKENTEERRLQRQAQLPSPTCNRVRKLGRHSVVTSSCEHSSISYEGAPNAPLPPCCKSPVLTPARSVPEMELEQSSSVPYQQLDSRRLLMGQMSSKSQTASVASDGSQVSMYKPTKKRVLLFNFLENFLSLSFSKLCK